MARLTSTNPPFHHMQPPLQRTRSTGSAASTTIDKPGKPLTSWVDYTLMSMKFQMGNSVSCHFHRSVGARFVWLYLIYDVNLSP